MLDIKWTEQDLSDWTKQQYVVRPKAMTPLDTHRLASWIDELTGWPETPGKWMKYYEAGISERQLCRIENFVQYHEGLSELLRGPKVIDAVSRLMGEAAVLFKEKVNFKLPGGSGFGAHQDAPAFGMFGHSYHITMMIAVDTATTENGCLEMSSPTPIGDILKQENGGTLHPDVEHALPWSPLPVHAGDVVFFDSYIPHRSRRNDSLRSRRALYITYNRLSDGDVRDAYFAAKRKAFPPECERIPGHAYGGESSPFNLGNPIR